MKMYESASGCLQQALHNVDREKVPERALQHGESNTCGEFELHFKRGTWLADCDGYQLSKRVMNGSKLKGVGTMNSIRNVALGVLATTLMIGLAHADRFDDNVRDQLLRVRTSASWEGYRETHSESLYAMGQGQSHSFGLTLRSGTTYKIVGACDNDCSDLDLVLYDENGNEIDRDDLIDSMPIVEVRPRRTARFRLVAKMHECSAEPCSFGVAVLGQ